MVATLSVQADRFEDGEVAYDRGDYAAAAQLWREAAEQGHAKAQYNLGILYYKGQGTPRDYAKAMQWFRKAAYHEIAQAQYNLGIMYHQAEGTPINYVKAALWYRKAAEQGHAKAQYNLGVLYKQGHGVPQDSIQAMMWFRLAASNLPAGHEGHKEVEEQIEKLAAQMAPQQLEEAKRRAQEWKPTK